MIISKKHDAVILPYRDDVHNLLPDSREFSHNGRNFLRVKYGLEETKLLNNLGVITPAPILNKYNWSNDTPFDSQKTTAAMLTSNKRAYVLSSMGVGKTRAALYSFDFLRQQGVVKNCLVVAPLSTLFSVWNAEIFECFHHLSVGVLHGTRTKRASILGEDHDIYIINHDGIGTIQKELCARKFQCIIVDELATYRNKRTKRWKDLRPLIKDSTFAWGLTGAPTPNGPTDAYGQVKLLSPSNMTMSFRAFQQQTMRQVSMFRWVPRTEANDIVHTAMQPSIRYTLEECHDLPPVTMSTRDIELTAKQKKAYKQLMNEYAMDSRKSGVITVVNEAARLNKLIQVGAGFAYNKEGKGEYLDAKNRLLTTLEIVKESEGKVIIFANYKWAVAMLYRVFQSRYGTLEITGKTSAQERTSSLALFRKSNSHRVLVAHPGCMAHGLNLQVASTIIWYTPTHSLETYLQANARITRPGQTRHMSIYHLVGTPVEKKIFQKLQRNEKTMGILLEMFQSQELGV